MAFDLETTGVDRYKDVPVSFALVTVTAGMVSVTDASIVDPGREIPEGAARVHGITTGRARREGIPLAEAIQRVTEALVAASAKGVPVVGMKLDYDLTMVDACAQRSLGRGLLDAGFCGPVLDALVIDRHLDRFRKGKRTLVDLCTHYGVEIARAHDAEADAVAALRVLIEMTRKFDELADASAGELHESQKTWHREWAESFSKWRVSQGMAALGADDAQWPIAGGTRG